MNPSAPLTAQTVIAHRGASALLPEHTMVAWERAVELGADYIEQDLQMTADGVLVVLHDATLDRTARGPADACTGPVARKTRAELRLCEVSTWKIDALREAGEHAAAAALADLPLQRIPTLEEVFERFGTDGSVRYYVEIKQPGASPGMEAALLRLLERHGLIPTSPDDRTVLVQSFSAESLRSLSRTEPRLPLVQLVGAGEATTEDVEARLDSISEYAVGIGPDWRLVTSRLVRIAHENELVVHPYTVNDRERMRDLLDLGVDGMFTDVPELLLDLIGRRLDPRGDDR